MSDSNRLISPYWNVVNHCFVPIDWSLVPRTDAAKRIIQNIQSAIIDPQIPVFVRGSIIEERAPHPKADIDIIYLAPQNHTRRVFMNIKHRIRQDIDINVYSEDASEPKAYLPPLIHARSMQIAGPPFLQKAFPADREFIFNLWNQYGIDQQPHIIASNDPKRISKLKQIFRVLGLLSFLDGEGFTRDIHCGLSWLYDKETHIGTIAKQIWAQRSQKVPLNVSIVQEWERNRFFQWNSLKR